MTFRFKELCSTICILVSSLALTGQVFFTESFETTGDYTLGNAGDCSCVIATVDATDGQNDNFTDVTDDDISHNFGNDYSGEDGSRYWASEDNDDNNVGGSGNPVQCVTLTVNIAGRSNLQFSGLFGGFNNNTSTSYEMDDDMEVFYQIDGGGFTKILDWHENAAENNISLDTDGDQFGDNVFILSTVMQTVTAPMPGIGNSLQIRICTHSNTSSEEFSFDLIQVAEVAALPVDLVKFEATAKEQEVLLEWTTSGETNNSGFELQHSPSGQAWNPIGFITGHGTTLQEQYYQFIDTKPVSGSNYYRLKQLDENGESTYSPIRIATIDQQPMQVKVVPNPNDGRFRIDIVRQTPIVSQLRLFDSRGVLVWEKQLSASNAAIFQEDLNIQQSGLYYLVGQTGSVNWTGKIVVK